VGRNRAVADLPGFKLRGFVAWVLWSFVHLFTIMGVKNRMFVFLNWSWNYFTYDQSLRLLIKPKQKFQQNESLVSFENTYENQPFATKIPVGQDLISKLTSN
jgi:NADH dehydrogenase